MWKLQQPVKKDGLGFPKLLFYYYAFGLRHLAHWALPPERAPPWHSIEQSVSEPLPLLHCLSTRSKCRSAHPIVSHLQSIWRKIAGMAGFDQYLHIASSIWQKIGKLSFLLKDWVERGILKLGDLYLINTPKSFEHLKQQYNLPRTQSWRYFQLNHLLRKTFGSQSPKR